MNIDPAVEAAARAVAAGTPVDWAALWDSVRDPQSRQLLKELQVIAGVVDLIGEHSPASATSAAEEGRNAVAADPTTAWGALKIVRHVGSGSFGDVYQAYDPRLARTVALKLLRAPVRQRVTQTAAIEEGRLLARVRHSNVVSVYGADHIDGRTGIWMEFVEGRTLEAIVRQNGPLGVEEASAIGVAISGALAAVHGEGLIHRDVKAQNVMRADDGRIVLMDFGTGREIDELIGRDAAGVPGYLVGTPVYVAPEILAGEAATPQSDLYSLGVLLFYLVTGSYPVLAPTAADLRAAHEGGTHTRLANIRPDLPAEFVDIVECALATDRSDRYPNAEAMKARLAAFLRQDAPKSAVRLPRRLRWFAAAAAAAALAVAGVSVWREVVDGRRERGRNGQLAIPSGSAIRQWTVPDFQATGEPSRTGHWVGGVEWNLPAGPPNLVVLDLFTNTKRVLTANTDPHAYTFESAVSTDDQRVAYSWYFSTRQDASELRVVDVDGHHPSVAYRNPDGETHPIGWATDGRRVLVLRSRSRSVDLAWVDVQDGSVQSVTELADLPRKASLSPDGRLVLYDARTTSGRRERHLEICDTSTGHTTQLLADVNNDFSPVWRPDGSGAVFKSCRSGTPALWSVPVADAAVTAVEPKLVRGDLGDFFPIGFGSASTLLYEGPVDTVDVYIARFDPGTERVSPPHRVSTQFLGTNLFSDWSPDAKALVYVSRRRCEGEVLVIRDLADAGERVVRSGLDTIAAPRWSPDSQSILVAGGAQGGAGLYNVPLNGKPVTPVLIRNGFIVPEWQPDAGSVLFSAPSKDNRAYSIQSFDLASGTERRLVDETRGLNPFFAVSRGGSSIAYLEVLPCDKGVEPRCVDSLTLNVMDRSANTHRALVAWPTEPAATVAVVGWSQDDRDLVVARTLSPPKDHAAELMLVPVSGGVARPLGTIALPGARSFRLSPDASAVSFEAGATRQGMFVVEGLIRP